eukprot:10294105-Prorocentrum_lima.AAC.1
MTPDLRAKLIEAQDAAEYAHDTREPSRPFYEGSAAAGSQSSMPQIGQEVTDEREDKRRRTMREIQRLMNE